jgi:TyrR family helix-turn-helix protein/PAS domain S-box-containing protein
MYEGESALQTGRTPFLHCNAEGEALDYNEAAVKAFGGLEALQIYFRSSRFQEIFQQLASSREPYIEKIRRNDKNYDLTITPSSSLQGTPVFTVLLQSTDPWERWAEGDQNIRLMIQEVIDCIADGIIVVDAAGYVRQTNRSYELMVDINKEEYENKHVQLLQDTGYTHASLTPMVVKQKQKVTIVDVRNNKDLLLTGVPFRNNEKQIVGVICNVRDVSELQQLKRKLDESKKNERIFREQLITFAQGQDEKQVITTNKKMRQIFELALKIAPIDSSVLILGDSGVGKGILAEFIHQHSKRADKPFITVNCGAIPESLIESELFGYEAGAFTGASRSGKAGLFELANHGTIFLDEIGELPLNMQVKMLQTIQDGTVRRIGGKSSIKLNLRIISATNRDLKEMIDKKTFREDLYYRLNVVPINLPSLIERKEDIIPLAVTFLEQLNEKYSLNKRFSTDLMKSFLAYKWPGNIRELQNVVESLVVTSSEDEITLGDLYEINCMIGVESEVRPLKEILGDMERNILEDTYKRMKSSRKSAAVLGISQSAYVKKAKKYGISLTGDKS